MLNGSGESENCQLMIHARTPSATSSGPKRLAGRHAHQYRPITIGAAVRYAKYSALATGRWRWSLVSASQIVTATIGTTATPSVHCLARGDTATEIFVRAGTNARCKAAPSCGW